MGTRFFFAFAEYVETFVNCASKYQHFQPLPHPASRAFLPLARFWRTQERLCTPLETQGADSRGEGKSKREEKYGTKKSKERREEPLGTMFYQTSSKRSPPFCLLIGQKNTKFFSHQSEARTATTVWNWSGKTLSPRAVLPVLYFSSCHIFPPV